MTNALLDPATDPATDPSPPAAGVRGAVRSAWRRSASDPVLAVLDQGLVSGTRFVTTVAVGRAAGEEELGLYSLAMAGLILAGVAQEAVVTKPYTVLREGEVDSDYAGSALLHHAALGGGLAVALLAAAGIAAAAGAGTAAIVLAVTAAAVPLSLLWEFARRMSFAHLRLRSALAVDGGLAALQLGALAGLWATGRLTALTALAATAAAGLIAGSIWLARSRTVFRLGTGRVGADWRRSWQFGRWVLAAQLCGQVNGSAPQWVLAAAVGIAATGRFAAAQNVVLLCNPLILAVASLLVAQTAAARRTGGPTAVRRVAVRAAVALTAFAGLFWLGLLVAAGPLLGLLYGTEFASAAPVILLLGLAPLAWSVSTAFEAGLSAIDRPEVGFRAMLAGLLTTVAAAVPLSAIYAAPGAGAAVLLGSAVAAVALAVPFLRLTSASPAPEPA
ncbi:lipopolysaccharide biosynthesis protein [Alienimonas chondri]|uniref:Polysaccharide biosynthesis protein n=1 Tax=Alienimonas chondri TaxID=2681879 RepID=A0ABX1VAL8_9PLAN|nr:lipopolysaccharide biosynthesis protein [Alienimonas chondri]NNJ24990.1 hypothetical protein [Alienimonas chondri]